MFVLSNGYVYFSKYCDDDRARVSLGIKTIKGPDGLDRATLKKSEQLILSRIEDAVIKFEESNNRMQLPIKKEEMEDVVFAALGKKRKKISGFVADFKKMLEDMRSGNMLKPRDHTRYKEDTIINYANVLQYLQIFSEETGTNLTYDIDEEWVNSFIVWLTKPKKLDKRHVNGGRKRMLDIGYSKNSIAMIVGNLKSFLSHMYKVKKHKSLFFKDDVFNLSREDADTEALNLEEVEILYSLTLPPHQDRARDVFVFACWVGLRSEDLQQINEYKLKGKYFEFDTEKTGARVIIPANPMAKAIYDKYNGNMPVFKNNNNLNEHIKNICNLAGFNEPCLVVMTRGGVKTKTYYEKWDMISIHSARRSFATNAYRAGIPTLSIMKITGHTTERSFMKYIRISKMENAATLADHPFFN